MKNRLVLGLSVCGLLMSAFGCNENSTDFSDCVVNAGKKVCLGGQLVTCSEYGNEVDRQNCASGLVCQDGACVSTSGDSTTTKECEADSACSDTQRCNTTTYKCEAVTCDEGKVAKNHTCEEVEESADKCVDSCDEEGRILRCEGGAQQAAATCEPVGEHVTEASCKVLDSGAACVNTACEAGYDLSGDGLCVSDKFMMTLKLDGSEEATIRLKASDIGSACEFTVDWGDGSEAQTVASCTDEAMSHTYAAGVQNPVIAISGKYAGFMLPEGASVTINSFGAVGLGSYAFSECGADFAIDASAGAPDPAGMSGVGLFKDCVSSNFDVSAWDVSQITDMHEMFSGATGFNGDLSAWNVSSVTNMKAMFYKASSFNKPIGSWNVSKVTDMSLMFSESVVFDQDLSAWNVNRVSNMENIFASAVGLSKANYCALFSGEYGNIWTVFADKLGLDYKCDAAQ